MTDIFSTAQKLAAEHRQFLGGEYAITLTQLSAILSNVEV